MKKGDIITGRVDRVAFPNRGLVRTEEGTVTVKNTVEGQTVEAQIQKKHGEKRAEARLLRVISPSPLETAPRCPHFGLCGGCTWQSLPYEETIKLKAQQVKALLDQAVGEAEAAVRRQAMDPAGEGEMAQHLSNHEADGADTAHTPATDARYPMAAGDEEAEETGSAHARKNILDIQSHFDFQGIKPSPAVYEYRNKMEFTFGDEYRDGPLAVGQHRRGGFYDILTVTDCCIVDADFRAILRATRDFWGQRYADRAVTYYHRMRHQGFLRHLLIRKARHTGEILVDLVTTTQEEHAEDIRLWVETLLDLPLDGTIRGILHTRNDSLADAVIDQGTEILFGEDSFTEELLGLKFRVTPFSFFQTNSEGAEVLYQTARDYLQGICGTGLKEVSIRHLQTDNGADGTIVPIREESHSGISSACAAKSEAVERETEDGEAEAAAQDACHTKAGEPEDADRKPVLFDLYSGTGTISQLMAKSARKVVGVEIVEEAVQAARENAAMNGITNCEFIAGDVLKVIDQIPDKPDVIVLDPPRDGIHPKALPKILKYQVPNILYISCKPTSLARDIPAFYLAGYRLQKAVCVDMFPWTTGVETVCLLSNTQKKKSYVTLDVEMKDYHRIVGDRKTSDKPAGK